MVDVLEEIEFLTELKASAGRIEKEIGNLYDLLIERATKKSLEIKQFEKIMNGKGKRND